jgi:L-iditol 2-dehydrogenase
MNAGVLHAIGDIRCDRVPVPVPGAGEVLVRVGACGICGSDIARVWQTGMYHLPEIPGHEFAGTVEALGPEVEGVTVGTRVTVIPLIQCGVCPSCLVGEYSQCDNYGYLGSRSAGGFAEYVKAPARNLIVLPEAVDMETGALTEVMAVALHGVRRAGSLTGGEKVAVFGAGTVGALAAQWLKVLGAGATCCVDVVAGKLEVAAALGVDLCLNAREANVADALNRWTDGKGVSLAVEASGANAALVQAIACCAKGAHVVLLGRQEHPVQMESLTYETILRRQLNIHGSWAWSAVPRREWETVLHFAAKGDVKVRPLISHRYGIEGVREAFDMLRGGSEQFHKVLLVNPPCP